MGITTLLKRFDWTMVNYFTPSIGRDFLTRVRKDFVDPHSPDLV